MGFFVAQTEPAEPAEIPSEENVKALYNTSMAAYEAMAHARQNEDSPDSLVQLRAKVDLPALQLAYLQASEAWHKAADRREAALAPAREAERKRVLAQARGQLRQWLSKLDALADEEDELAAERRRHGLSWDAMGLRTRLMVYADFCRKEYGI